MKMRWTLYTTALACCLFSGSAVAYEEPAFHVVANAGGIEYRQYAPYLAAETIVAGDQGRDAAANEGFRRLFDYISGDNTTQAELSAEPIVKQQRTRTKISMTAPVQQTPLDGGWSIAFVVPSKFTLNTVPRPTDPRVKIKSMPGALVAVVRFSGRWTDRNVSTHKVELTVGLKAAGVSPVGAMSTAFYNAPFSLPFTRRNEVMVEVADLPKQ